MKTPFIHLVPTEITANLRYRAAIHRRVLKDPLFAEVLWDACAIDPLFYVNAFCYTYDPRCEPFAKLPFILYPYQREGLLDILDAINKEDLLIEKSRDMGASWLCVIAFEWMWHFLKWKSFLMVSRTEDYVDNAENPKSLFWKVDFLHNNLPQWLMPPGYNRNNHRRKLHITNPFTGSVIDGESTTGRVARGDRRTGILLDEFAAVDQGHGVLSSTRDATNCRLFNSTPEGIANAYYDIRQTDIKKLRFHWSQHPIKSKGLYTTAEDGTLKILDEENYPENYQPILDGKLRSPWYDGECKRAASVREIAQELDINYLGSGSQFFLPASIEEAIRKFARPPMTVGNLDYDATTAEPTQFREEEGGYIRLWCLLNKENNIPKEHRYVLGADVSAGTGASNSTLCGYDAVTKEKILEYANPYIRPEEFAKQAVAIARWMGGAHLIWESNGPGRQFGSRVVELKYFKIHLRRREEALSQKVSQIPGWPSTLDGKLAIMGNYRSGIEKGTCVNRSKEALEECLEYVFNSKGGVSHSRENDKIDPSGARSNHGDRVMGDTLAWHELGPRKIKPEQAKPKTPVGCLKWRQEQREAMETKPGRELLASEGW